MTRIITRFAPSPTGFLHVGGARTALFNWLLARHNGGSFLLRIEDTDLQRSTHQACLQLVNDLKWLGLQWDNEELFFQSKRVDVYNRIIDDLLAKGLAYKAYETQEEVGAMRAAAREEKRSFVFRRPEIAATEVARHEARGTPHVVRFIMPVREHQFFDQVLGKPIIMPANEAQDFVIRKADGMPTYHFAVVVDDAHMQVTHVLRGQEHLKNTFYHIALQEALKLPRPIYGHLPVIMNMDGSKMGKRDRDKLIRQRAHEKLKAGVTTLESLAGSAAISVQNLKLWLEQETRQLDIPQQSGIMKNVGIEPHDLPEILVHDFRKNGYLPEALLSFLALLGWNPGDGRERMTVPELIDAFAIEGIGKANARFARDKLLSFNTDTCASVDAPRLLAGFNDFLSVNPDSPVNRADDETRARLLAMKRGFRTFREVEQVSQFFFLPDEQIKYAADAVEKVLRKQGGERVLNELRLLLATAPRWDASSLETIVKTYGESQQLGLGKVAQPLRVAISGSTISPPIFESLALLGKEATLRRIDRCLASALEPDQS